MSSKLFSFRLSHKTSKILGNLKPGEKNFDWKYGFKKAKSPD